jgi:hypothetical protein
MQEEIENRYRPNRHERRKRGALFRKKYGKELFTQIVSKQKEIKKQGRSEK